METGMRLKPMTALFALCLATPVVAQDASGDPDAGERLFNRCKACHMIVDDSGEQIVRGGQVGPNLYGVMGGPAAAVEGFRYGDGIQKAAEMGLEWTEENFAAYVADPQGFLREFTGDGSVRSRMAFRLNDGAEDVYAYLVSLSE